MRCNEFDIKIILYYNCDEKIKIVIISTDFIKEVRCVKIFRRIEGIGEVNANGDVYDKCPYDGAKGFKVVRRGDVNFIYSFEKQKKLFALPVNVPIEFNEKGLVLPLAAINYVLRKDKKIVLEYGLLGIFNPAGELIKYGKKVELQEECFKIATENSTECCWETYSYDGEKIE